MKPRKIPMRMCVVTKEKFPKKELIRVVRTEDGIVVDESGKVNGHGAYLKKDKDVFDKAKQTKILTKVLETEIPKEVYDSLYELIK